MLLSVDSRTYILSKFIKYKNSYPFLDKVINKRLNFLETNSGPQNFLSDLVFVIDNNKSAEITFNFFSSDIHLINSGFYSPIWKYMKPKKKEKVVLRLDGIGIDDPNKDSKVIKKEIICLISKCRFLIYQSEFSRNCFQDVYNSLPNGRVITNGAKTLSKTDFHTKKLINYLKNRFKGNFFTLAGRFTGRKRIKEVIDQFNESEIGNLVVLSNVPEKLQYRNNRIIYLGMLKPTTARHIIANSTALIHFDKYDWCPNLVVSAIRDKVPVICSNFGGTPEITGSNGLIIEEFPKSLPKNLEGINYVKESKFPSKIFKDCISNIYENGLKINFNKSFFIESAAKEYIDTLKNFV